MYRKNTASQFVCFQMLLTATGAVATGLSPAIRRCIDGTFAAGGGTVTEDSAGFYKYAMAQADTNGNDISLMFSAATAMPVCINFVTTACDPTNAATFGITDIDATISSRLATSGYTAPSNLTAAQIATGIWQDTTAGDFTTALSVGKSLMNGVALGTGLTVNDITTKTGFSLSGTQTFNVTGNITGNLSGSVGSVTGAVGSVTGLTASNLDATISSRMATYTQPTGFLAATFPSGTVANTTNIISITGNITGNLSGSVGSVTSGVTVTTNNDKTGYTASTVSDKTGYALTSGERDSIANDVLDIAAGVETGWTLRQALRIMLSALSGKASGLATTSVVYRDMADTKNRISATVDSSGNRTVVTRDAT